MSTPAPKRRGRPPKAAASPQGPPAAAHPTATFGASEVTAHRPLGLLEVQDSADLDALMLDSRVGRCVLARLSPTFALLRPGQEQAALEALRRAGHTPRVDGPSVRPAADPGGQS